MASPNIFVACTGKTVSVWDPKNNNVLKNFSLPGSITDVSCSSNVKLIAATLENDSQLQLIDVQNFTVCPASILPTPATCLSFVPKQTDRVVLGQANGSVCVWECAKSKIQQNFAVTRREGVRKVHSNGTSVASGQTNGMISIFGHQTGQQLTQLACPAGSSALLGDLRFGYLRTSRLGAAYDTGTVALWDLNGTRQPLFSYDYKNGGHKAPCTGVAFSRVNAKVMFSVGLDKELIGYDIVEKKIVLNRTFSQPLTCIDTSEDGNGILVGTCEGQVFSLDLRTTQMTEYKQPQGSPLLKVYFQPNDVTSRSLATSKLKAYHSTSSLPRVPQPPPKARSPSPIPANQTETLSKIPPKFTSRLARPTSRNPTPTNEPHEEPKSARRSLSQGNRPLSVEPEATSSTFLPIENASEASGTSQLPVKSIPAPTARPSLKNSFSASQSKGISRSPSPDRLERNKPHAATNLSSSNSSAFAVVPSTSNAQLSFGFNRSRGSAVNIPQAAPPAKIDTTFPKVSENLNGFEAPESIFSPVQYSPAPDTSKRLSDVVPNSSNVSIDSLYSPVRDSLGSRPRDSGLFVEDCLNFSLGPFSPVRRSSLTAGTRHRSSNSWLGTSEELAEADMRPEPANSAVIESQDNNNPTQEQVPVTGFQPFVPHLMQLQGMDRSSEETSPSLQANVPSDRNESDYASHTPEVESSEPGAGGSREQRSDQDFAKFYKEFQEFKQEMQERHEEVRETLRLTRSEIRELLHRMTFDISMVRNIAERDFNGVTERLENGFNLVETLQRLMEEVNHLRSLY